VFGERLAVWGERLTRQTADRGTVVAERDGVVIGFAHVVFEDDPRWGALVDNLHVAHDAQRQGIATRLMAEVARRVQQRIPPSGLYLWVLEQNANAQAFYDACGGTVVERAVRKTPASETVNALRYAWPDVADLVAGR
jgi:ribosomal protein S18 acetylase RimI-like enzyme